MTYVHDVGELLTLLRLPKVAIIGTSLGGLVAMTMAFLQPSRLAAVVLNDVGPELEQRGLARIADYVGRLPPVSSWKEAAIQAKLVNGTALPDLTDEEWLQFARNTYKEKNDGTPILDMDPKIGDVTCRISSYHGLLGNSFRGALC
jgi:pimeloyl-ACP methyl ester carboxylesterase